MNYIRSRIHYTHARPSRILPYVVRKEDGFIIKGLGEVFLISRKSETVLFLHHDQTRYISHASSTIPMAWRII